MPVDDDAVPGEDARPVVVPCNELCIFARNSCRRQVKPAPYFSSTARSASPTIGSTASCSNVSFALVYLASRKWCNNRSVFIDYRFGESRKTASIIDADTMAVK